MFRTLRLRTLRCYLRTPRSLQREVFSGKRCIASMAGLLKKPVKIALVQLASGISPTLSIHPFPIHYPTSSPAPIAPLRSQLTTSQAQTKQRTCSTPATRSSKPSPPAPRSSSCQNASTPPTARNTSRNTRNNYCLLLLARSSRRVGMRCLLWRARRGFF